MKARIPAAPILDQAAAIERIERLRAAGAPSIALVTGVFEILQGAHARFLDRASRQADLLVAGIVADREVRASRGSGRPLLSATDRATMVAGLSCVDLVVVLEGPEHELFEQVRPDVVCRSGGTAGTAVTTASAAWREVVIEHAGDPIDIVSRLGEPES